MKYSSLVELYEQLESTTKRLEKTRVLSLFLRKVPEDDLDSIALLLQGRIFPAHDENTIGVAARLVLKAISVATGIDQAKVEKEWKKTGDLGVTAEHLTTGKKQRTLVSSHLTVRKVFDNLRKLASIEGEGAVDKKMQLIAELLTSAEPKEAKYIIRTVLEDLRVGVGDGTLRDAIVWAFFESETKLHYDEKEKTITPENREEYNKLVAAVQKAYDVTADFGTVARDAKTKGLKGIEKADITIGKPLKVMLFQKADDLKDAFERVGKPAALEYKYDGFRLQVHKKSGVIKLFTRRLDEVTKQFPDVVEAVAKNVKGDNFILDGEAVGFDPKTKKYLSFQGISQRIKRKYDIKEIAEKFPVELNVFDLMAHNGENVMDKPFIERRKLIEKIVSSTPSKIVVAKHLITGDLKEAQKFYDESLARGEEGIMAKNLEGIYKPGSRVGFGVKVKPTMETLDLVIVGAEWGEGKRSAWLSSFTLACQDDDGKLLEIGKVGTGIKELEQEEGGGVTFDELTKELKPSIIDEKGKEVKVKPKLVIEVAFEEIQKSPTYSSGYALRFPRLIRLREDKSKDDVSTITQVEKAYKGQRGR